MHERVELEDVELAVHELRVVPPDQPARLLGARAQLGAHPKPIESQTKLVGVDAAVAVAVEDLEDLPDLRVDDPGAACAGAGAASGVRHPGLRRQELRRLQLGCALLLLVEFALQCQELRAQLSSIFRLFECAVRLLGAPLVDLVLLEGKSQLSCSPCGDFRSQF